MRPNISAGKEDILIFAPHCDDGVMMAGGYASKTKKYGGRVKVVFLTGNDTRLNEAYNAWKIIGLNKTDLIYLAFDNKWSSTNHIINEYYNFKRNDDCSLTLKNVHKKLEIIRNLINEINPEIIFIPLYEGGHIGHDITNYLVSTALKMLQKKITLYECPEYNYYFSIIHTPEIFLDIFSKLIPFVDYNAPRTFCNSSDALYPSMTQEELDIKKQMLSQFVSQRPEVLLLHFGFNDRFNLYDSHNYYLPPHDYGNYWIYNLCKKLRSTVNRFIRGLFSKPYCRLSTIKTENNLIPLSPLLKNVRLGLVE